MEARIPYSQGTGFPSASGLAMPITPWALHQREEPTEPYRLADTRPGAGHLPLGDGCGCPHVYQTVPTKRIRA